MDLLLELIFSFIPTFIMLSVVFSIVRSAATKNEKRKSVFQTWIENAQEEHGKLMNPFFEEESVPVHDNEASGMAHDDTRDHRIYEQETKVKAHSESKLEPKRLAFERRRLQREPIRKPNAQETNVHYQAPTYHVKSSAFKDQNEIRKALIYGEILATPVSQKSRKPSHK